VVTGLNSMGFVLESSELFDDSQMPGGKEFQFFLIPAHQWHANANYILLFRVYVTIE